MDNILNEMKGYNSLSLLERENGNNSLTPKSFLRRQRRRLGMDNFTVDALQATNIANYSISNKNLNEDTEMLFIDITQTCFDIVSSICYDNFTN